MRLRLLCYAICKMLCATDRLPLASKVSVQSWCDVARYKRMQSTVINLSVCLCVHLSVHQHISGTAGPIVTIFVHIPCGRGSVLLRRRCDTLCTSGFMDDVTLAALRYQGGV